MPLSTNTLSRTNSAWPFAKGSEKDSVGAYRGVLYPAKLVAGIHCWSAKGEALRWFDDSIRGSILEFVSKHSDKAQETNDYLAIELFMVGKRVERTKPVVMFISDDRKTRKEAFNLVKTSNILESFPEFELGHTDLGKIIALAGEAIFVSCSSRHTSDGPVLQVWREPVGVGGEDTTASATVGGIIVHCGRYMLLTVDHFLENPQRAPHIHEREGTESDECEITGLANFVDDDDEEADNDFVDETSKGSISELEGSNSDGELDSPNVSAQSSSILSLVASSTGTAVPADFMEKAPSDRRREELDGTPCGIQVQQEPANAIVHGRMFNFGRTVAQDRELDYTLIEIDPSSLSSIPESLLQQAIALTDENKVARFPRETSVWTVTPTGGKVEGLLSGSVYRLRLPYSTEFTAVYKARFAPNSIRQGDCGSWVRDTVTGHLYGHIIAGSSPDGEAVIIPAWAILTHARSLNKPNSSPQQRFLRKSRRLVDAIIGRDMEAIEARLEDWADPNTELDSSGTRAIHHAAFHCDTKLVKLLTLYGAIVDTKAKHGQSILFLAVCSRDRLLQTRPTHSSTWVAPSHTVKIDSLVLDTIKTIFLAPSVWEDFADMVDDPDHDGVTPLMAAAEQGLDMTVEYLLDQGANAKLRDRNGRTALDHAERAGMKTTAKILRERLHDEARNPNSTLFRSVASQTNTQIAPSSTVFDDSETLNLLFCEFHSLAESSCKRSFKLQDGEGWVNHHLDHLRHSPGNPPDTPEIMGCWFCDCLFVPGEPEDSQHRIQNLSRRMRHIYMHIAQAYISERKTIQIQAREDLLMTSHMAERNLMMSTLSESRRRETSFKSENIKRMDFLKTSSNWDGAGTSNVKNVSDRQLGPQWREGKVRSMEQGIDIEKWRDMVGNILLSDFHT